MDNMIGNPLDYVGTKLLDIRRTGDGNDVCIRMLRGERSLLLTEDEWLDLLMLAVLFWQRAGLRI